MRKGIVALALGALLALPQTAAAVNWNNMCIATGGFEACASVHLQTSYNAGADQTTVTMQVWNLEGTLGDAHTITSLGLYQMSTPWTADMVGPIQVNWVTGTGTTDVTSGWTAQGANDIKTLEGVNLQVAGGTSGNSGINGCTALPGGTKWLTCSSSASSFPGMPYMEFTFTVDGTLDEQDLALRWHTQQVGGTELSLKCDTGGNTGDYPVCVPEPVSTGLLATGLIALGGAQFFRRRRGFKDLEI